MARTTVPFHYGFFSNALGGLVGRQPDLQLRFGNDGHYHFRYAPKNQGEAATLANAAQEIQEWLALFDIEPFRSRCEYGLLPRPQPGEEGRDFLDIVIVTRKK